MFIASIIQKTVVTKWLYPVCALPCIFRPLPHSYSCRCCCCQYWYCCSTLSEIISKDCLALRDVCCFYNCTIVYVCCSFICEKKGRVFWPNEKRRYRASICISGGKETRGSVVRGFPADVVFVFSPGVVFAFVSGEIRCGKGRGLKLMLHCRLSLIWKNKTLMTDLINNPISILDI